MRLAFQALGFKEVSLKDDKLWGCNLWWLKAEPGSSDSFD